MKPLNIMLVGIGGQGVVLASEILSNMFITWGLCVKKTEIHGMAQRGGSVTSQLRVGHNVYSPTIPRGQCDYLLAFNIPEGRQYVRELRSEGVLLFAEDEEKNRCDKKTWNMLLLGKFLNHLINNGGLNTYIRDGKLNGNKTTGKKINKITRETIIDFVKHNAPKNKVEANIKAIKVGFA